MTRAETIEAHINAEMDRFKQEGGSFIDETECIAKIAFFSAVLRAGFPEGDKFEARFNEAMAIGEEIVKQTMAPGDMRMTEVKHV